MNGGSRFVRFLRSPLPWLLLAVPLATYTMRRILQTTGGELAMPLDDAFIHFQYARALADGHPFVYTAGSARVAGATSLLWPTLLAPFAALGHDGDGALWAAWWLGWAFLALSAYEAFRLARGMLAPIPAALAGAMQLGFGANVWLASSGMEAMGLSWAMLRAVRRSAEWAENDTSVKRTELYALALLAPLFRPEGVVASLVIAASLATSGRGRPRAALLTLALATTPWLINWLGAGGGSTTARAKWLVYSPYLSLSDLLGTIFRKSGYVLGVLFDGGAQAAVFVPSGSATFAFLGLLSLLFVARNSARRRRALAVVGLALAILLPTSYDSFLDGRLRYFWPFVGPWLIGVAALIHVIVNELSRFARVGAIAAPALSALALLAVTSKLNGAIEDLAKSSAGILAQQVWLGKWAGRALPASARIGVNDAGAIAYYSKRPVFDVVGLTTRGEAAYWTAGPGSRFEHYERLPRAELPTHFIVYPGWFALDGLLGRCLTERHVAWTSVLGSPTMRACEADYHALGSGARPMAPTTSGLLDELDVSDLESEASHSYELLPARRIANQLYVHQNIADAGRAERTRDSFLLKLEPEGQLVLRVVVDGGLTLTVRADGEPLADVALPGRGWHEPVLRVPSGLRAGPHRVEVSARGQPLTSLHYWSYRRAALKP